MNTTMEGKVVDVKKRYRIEDQSKIRTGCLIDRLTSIVWSIFTCFYLHRKILF